MNNPITILIVDDYEIIRNGIRSFLETQPEFKVIGEASSGSDAVEIVTRLVPEIVLLDMSMPDMDGIQTTIKIRKVSPNTQVVILTSITDDKYIFPALKAGAVSYLQKNIRMDKLADTLLCVAQGEATFPPQVATSIIKRIRGEQNDDNLFLRNLSARELDVLRLIACGFTNGQIARKLHISENTVKGHVGNIRAKLQIADRVRLARFAWDNGIVSPQSNV